MIKFFRRIRQKLLSQGSLNKYLLYAIGEILLVMIGILLALQVNNWNEHRKAQERQQKLYANLKIDFQSRLNELEDFYVGGPVGSAGQLYIQNMSGKFELATQQPWVIDKASEDLGCLLFELYTGKFLFFNNDWSKYYHMVTKEIGSEIIIGNLLPQDMHKK